MFETFSGSHGLVTVRNVTGGIWAQGLHVKLPKSKKYMSCALWIANAEFCNIIRYWLRMWCPSNWTCTLAPVKFTLFFPFHIFAPAKREFCSWSVNDTHVFMWRDQPSHGTCLLLLLLLYATQEQKGWEVSKWSFRQKFRAVPFLNRFSNYRYTLWTVFSVSQTCRSWLSTRVLHGHSSLDVDEPLRHLLFMLV